MRPSALTERSCAAGCLPRSRYMYCCVSPALRYAIWPKLGSPTELLLSGGSAAASAPPGEG